MKLRRIMLSAALGASVLSLASCGVEKDPTIQVVDENGNVTEAKIEATEDKEKVAETVETMLNTKVDEKALEAIKGVTVSADAAVSGDITVLTTTTNVAATAHASAAVLFGDTLGFDVSANYSLNVKNSAVTVDAKGEAAAFTNGKYVYASAKNSTNDKEVKYCMDYEKAVDDILAMIDDEDFVSKEDIAAAKENMAEYFNVAKQYVGSILEETGYTEEDIKAYAEGGYLKVTSELDAAIKKFIEENEVVIASTTKDTVTFKANVAYDEKNKVEATVTLSTKTLLPVAATADLGAAAPEILLEIISSNITGVDLSMFSSMLSPETQNCKGNVSVKITYSAKMGTHDTTGYKEATVESIIEAIKGASK